ncbi:uncharacterized protein MONBRDRAFT_8184 [Monosiga brevicollis MX1]|uniref:PH domain-containing protein n=1 Tax=Monosiga brevicollis TaxID=81824 RepID=A9UZA7_MONBE|nr:uncharacterized protein MONBRDRAFT_8184 [Monosiga brevicollis MX1]EDQ89199.1 predicted protein [Monosiga brevicollis MX1]|eukprot:XP_001745775.1 hypothetical protein [Monosiga brevicollis MX1]
MAETLLWEGEIVKEGGGIKSWRRRFCKLTSQHLSYHCHKHGKGRTNKRVPLAQVQRVVPPQQCITAWNGVEDMRRCLGVALETGRTHCFVFETSEICLNFQVQLNLALLHTLQHSDNALIVSYGLGQLTTLLNAHPEPVAAALREPARHIARLQALVAAKGKHPVIIEYAELLLGAANAPLVGRRDSRYGPRIGQTSAEEGRFPRLYPLPPCCVTVRCFLIAHFARNVVIGS